jgi:hypothetical protein
MIKAVIFALFMLSLSNCAVMHADCNNVMDDPIEYRHCMANQGSQGHQYQIALSAIESDDYETAIRWLKRAAVPKYQSVPYYAEFESPRRGTVAAMNTRKPTPGHSGAIRLLVKIYEEGLGGYKNEKEAQRFRDMINKVY